MVKERTPLARLSGLLAAACVDNVTGAPAAVCGAAYQPLSLSVGDYLAIDPVPVQGCVILPSNSARFDVLFSDPTGGQLKSTLLPRLNVLRIR